MYKIQEIKIPNKLNIIIISIVYCLVLFFLWLASNINIIWSLPIGIIFSFILLTNYALMHEAAHNVLNTNKNYNYILGSIVSALFPMSFTLFEVTHHVHHRGNRTDHEMFDYYYPQDNKLIKFGQWYSILTGIYYPIIPIGSIIMAIAPWFFHIRLFKKSKTSGILFNEFDKKAVTKVRFEVILAIFFWYMVWHILSLQWQSVFILYGCFAFNWSTRQYVTHAWTPRDVINGALNLKVNPIMGKILLNGQWDHVHHKYPYLPWTELSNSIYHEKKSISFWKQYLSLWKGPKANFEESPNMISDIDKISDNICYR